MNLTRVLNSALPNIPARKLAESYPRLDPGATFKEHIEVGIVVTRVYVPSVGMFTLSKNEWKLAQLFDGVRNYEEIAEVYSQEAGIEYDAESVREFADGLAASNFWYKTPQEKNIQLLQMSSEERKKKLKKKSVWADLSDVDFPAFNPDRFVTWLHDKTRFIYTTWFTIVCIIAILASWGITFSHWSLIQHDTAEFYTFSNKTWMDVFLLYTLGMFVVGVHELAHAHACKHCGGRVPAMGFALVFLMPAFYTDTTEGFVHGTYFQRLMISFAGMWSEMLLCAIATPIWWGTAPDSPAHNSAHFVMMMTGLMCVLVNWNPLVKLDGYYMLADAVGIANLKEDSTAYTSAWVKKHIWRLPVEVPYIPKRRRLGFVTYALVSGAYSYMLLYVVARFAGNFVRNFSPEWGFIPEIGVALAIFRSRIRLLGNFMKFVYLDKKDRIVQWFTLRRTAIAAGVIALVLALPLWKESVAGKFVLEPEKEAIVRAHVPGMVSQVFVREGDVVPAGAPLATLSNVPLQSSLEDARAKLVMASDRVKEAAIHFQRYGDALMEKERSTKEFEQISEMNAALTLAAPIGGMVVTPKVQDQLGAYLKAGTPLAEIADLEQLRARIYISEYDLSKVDRGKPARIQLDGMVGRREGRVTMLSAGPAGAPLTETEQAASETQQFYTVEILVENTDKILKPGMTGLARVYGGRRSLGGMVLENMRNFCGRKLW